jgi:hypothetical protein
MQVTAIANDCRMRSLVYGSEAKQATSQGSAGHVANEALESGLILSNQSRAIGQRDLDDLGGVLGTKFLHNFRTVQFNGPRADFKPPGYFLARAASDPLRQHLLLSAGELLVRG